MSNYTITVGQNESGIGNCQCGGEGGIMEGVLQIDHYCKPALTGRYVHLKLKGQATLTICEIEVYEKVAGRLSYYCITWVFISLSDQSSSV